MFDFVPAYRGQLHYGPRYGSGFDPDGIWVRRDGVEVFRDQRATQRVVDRTDTSWVVELVGDDGDTFTGPVGFGDTDATGRSRTDR